MFPPELHARGMEDRHPGKGGALAEESARAAPEFDLCVCNCVIAKGGSPETALDWFRAVGASALLVRGGDLPHRRGKRACQGLGSTADTGQGMVVVHCLDLPVVQKISLATIAGGTEESEAAGMGIKEREETMVAASWTPEPRRTLRIPIGGTVSKTLGVGGIGRENNCAELIASPLDTDRHVRCGETGTLRHLGDGQLSVIPITQQIPRRCRQFVTGELDE